MERHGSLERKKTLEGKEEQPEFEFERLRAKKKVEVGLQVTRGRSLMG